MKKIFISVALTFMLMASAIFAASNVQNIEVALDSVNLKVNGQDVEASNILYNGTTYVPLRAVAEILGKKVGWDGNTNTASIDDMEGQEKAENPVAVITMESGETIKLELYPKEAPKTVENFVSLAKKGFYDGLTFHRIVPGFVVQGGDPNGNGTGGPGYTIEGEFTQNGVQNTIMHTRGVVSMARSSSPDSGGSQFFIVLDDAHHLNGEYAAFGKVIEGMEVVDKMASLEVDQGGMPAEKQVMKSINIK